MDLSAGAVLDPPVGSDDHRTGSENALVVLVEYGDYECPDCFGARVVVSEVLDRLGEDISFVWRHFPRTEVHPGAARAARAVEAAAMQGRFWDLHDKMLAYQGRLKDELLDIWVGKLDLDLERFRRDLDSAVPAERVRAHKRGGERSGVRGTPTFFIDGRRYEGRVGPDDLLRAIEPYLREAG